MNDRYGRKKILVRRVLLKQQYSSSDQLKDTSNKSTKAGNSEKECVTIGNWYKTLIDAEKNYSKTEREWLQVVWALKTLRTYLERKDFVVRLDNDALRWMMKISLPHGRLARGRLSLKNFYFTVVYRPGLLNQGPDALSTCTPNYREEAEVNDVFPTFEANTLTITRA